MRLHTRRTHKHTQEFWKRVRIEYLNDPDSLPTPLAFVASRQTVRWVRLELSDIDDIMKCVEWSEWSDFYDPFHFSPVTHKRNDKWN